MKKIIDKVKNAEKTYNQVKNWYQDRYETVLIQRNVLFLLVIGMVVIFGFTISGVIALNNEKVYEPFIVQVEDNTGVVTKVNNEAIRELAADKALRNSSLVRYILARENYSSVEHIYNYYTIVRLFSTQQVYDEFNASISPSNPNSPLGFGMDFKVETKIKSITDIDENQKLIQVRVDKSKISTRSKDNAPEWKKSYLISLKYAYIDAGLSEADRYLNPLGLQIIDYDINEEINATQF